MSDSKYKHGIDLSIAEWPQPICEIVGKRMLSNNTGFPIIQVSTPEDARLIIDSLHRFLKEIPKEFGGDK